MKNLVSRLRRGDHVRKTHPAQDVVERAIEPYFDRDYYLLTYPDVRASGQDPLTHYVKWGDREGRLPRPGFDPVKYRERYARTLDNALFDAVLKGRMGQDGGIDAIDEQRSLQASEADHEPISRNDDSLCLDPLAWEQEWKGQIGNIPAPPNGFFRLVSPEDLALITPRMNEDWYFARYPEAAEFGGSAAAHYLGVGWLLGHDPSPDFSTHYYLQENRDVARSGVNPLLHHLKNGPKEAWRRCATVAEAEVHGTFAGPLAMDVSEAIALDPMVALPADRRRVTSPFDLSQPVSDALRILRRDLGGSNYPHVILIPQVRMSGAARVAGTYAAVLAQQVGAENLLIVRTDGDALEHPEWFPGDVRSYDLSRVLGPVKDKQLHPQLLVDLLRGVGVRGVHLFNSRLGWDTLQIYGRQLSQEAAVTAYLFTWEETADGRKVGYPIQWLRDTVDHCHVIVCDSDALAEHIRGRFGLPATGPGAPLIALTPADLPDPAEFQADQARRLARTPSHRVLWAGRLDRQKRPDLLAAIARQMPETIFEVYGRSVVDKAPEDLGKLSNVALMGEYDDFASVIARDYDAFLYTAQWDGTPTILLDAVGQGLPIVASSVGGIGALLGEDRGWAITDIEDVTAYCAALRDARSNPAKAAVRAERAYHHARATYAPGPYTETVREIVKRMGPISDARAQLRQPSSGVQRSLERHSSNNVSETAQ